MIVPGWISPEESAWKSGNVSHTVLVAFSGGGRRLRWVRFHYLTLEIGDCEYYLATAFGEGIEVSGEATYPNALEGGGSGGPSRQLDTVLP